MLENDYLGYIFNAILVLWYDTNKEILILEVKCLCVILLKDFLNLYSASY